MTIQTTFSESEIKILEGFARQWVRLYPAIQRITLYDSAMPEESCVVVFKIQDDDPVECQRTIKDWAFCDWVHLRDTKFLPGFIREHEDEIMPWIQEPGQSLPYELVIEESQYILYGKGIAEQEIPSADIQNETTMQDPDTFIRSLKVFYDKEEKRIKVQEPGKKAKTSTFSNLKFSAETDKTWTTFLSILQGSNTYYVGQSGKPGSDKRKEYGRKLALLKKINEKLIIFFRKEFSLQIPADFKFYERNSAKGKGMYKFIFQTENNIEASNLFRSRYDKPPKNELLDHLKKMHTTYTEKPENWLKHKIKDATQVLIGKHGMTQDEIKNILFTKEEIQKDFSQYDFDTMDDVTDEP